LASRPSMSAATALRRHGQIIFALLKQEEESRRANPMEAILDMLEPIILVGIMSAAYVFLQKKNSSPLGGSPVLFYATGFYAKYFWIYLSKRMKRTITKPMQRFPIERRLDHAIVHTIVRIFDYSILGVLGFGGIYFFFTPDALP